MNKEQFDDMLGKLTDDEIYELINAGAKVIGKYEVGSEILFQIYQDLKYDADLSENTIDMIFDYFEGSDLAMS